MGCRWNLAFVLGLAIGLCSGPAIAAEQLVVSYGPLQVSFSADDLERFAETGDAPSSLGFYLGLANLDANTLRSLLTTKINVTQDLLDKALNTQAGERLLAEVIQVVHTPSQQADIQALRSALVQSARDDRQVSLLELLRHYPTQQMHVDGAQLIELANQWSAEPAE